MNPPLRTEPACMGTVCDAPASAVSKVSTSCSESDMMSAASRNDAANAVDAALRRSSYLTNRDSPCVSPLAGGYRRFRIRDLSQ